MIGGMRRSANARGSGLLEGPSGSQHGSGILSQSRAGTEASSPRSKYRKGGQGNSSPGKGNIFEYTTEPSDNPSWPHSEWLSLRIFLEAMNQEPGSVSVVSDHPSSSTSPTSVSPRKSEEPRLSSPGTFEEPLAVTLQPAETDPEEARGIDSPPTGSSGVLTPGQLWDPLPMPAPLSLRSTASEAGGGTTFHAVRLSETMWMTGKLCLEFVLTARTGVYQCSLRCFSLSNGQGRRTVAVASKTPRSTGQRGSWIP